MFISKTVDITTSNSSTQEYITHVLCDRKPLNWESSVNTGFKIFLFQVEVPMIHLGGRITHARLPSAFTPKIIAFSSGSVFFINTPNSPFSTLLFNRLSNALPRQFAQLRQYHHGSHGVISQFFFQCLWPEEQSRKMSVWLAVFNRNWEPKENS